MDDELLDQVRFQIPIALGLRYGTHPAGMADASSASSRTRLRFIADIQMSGPIRDVSSPTHQIGPLIPYRTHLGRTSLRRTTAKFRSKAFLERDFILLIQADGLDAPRCFSERDRRGSGTIAVQLTVIPKFNLPPIPSQEFIFLVDRSGSMANSRIETAKKTLTMLLRMLPGKLTKLNIFSFGSHVDGLWRSSQMYTQANLEYAVSTVSSSDQGILLNTGNQTQHVSGMDANYGGTEIRPAVDLVLRSRNLTIPTVVFVLTDGKVFFCSSPITLPNVDHLFTVIRH